MQGSVNVIYSMWMVTKQLSAKHSAAFVCFLRRCACDAYWKKSALLVCFSLEED